VCLDGTKKSSRQSRDPPTRRLYAPAAIAEAGSAWSAILGEGLAPSTVEILPCSEGHGDNGVSHNNNFDLLRLLAALQVVYMHSVAVLRLPPGGDLYIVLGCFPGVACFFLISGFLVTDSYLRSASVGDYSFRRALRIYPALIVNLVVIDLAMYATGGLSAVQWPGRYLAYFGVAAATASHDIGAWATQIPATYGASTFFMAVPSGVLWTLTVELSFYLILPIILALYQRNRWAGLGVILGLAIVSLAHAHQITSADLAAHPLAGSHVGLYFWIFALGILARLGWSRLSHVFEGKLVIWASVYAIATCALLGLSGNVTTLNYQSSVGVVAFIRVTLLAGLVLSAAYSFKSASSLLRGNDLSYSIYLYHMLLIYSLIGVGLTAQSWLWLVVYGGAGVIAAISWFLIERPVLRLKYLGQREWSLRRVGAVEKTGQVPV